jgi:hypothetical protein
LKILCRCVLDTDLPVDEQMYRLDAHINEYVDLFETRWKAEKSAVDPDYKSKLRPLVCGSEIGGWMELPPTAGSSLSARNEMMR